MRVADTDYNQFATVFFKKVSQNQEYFKITLYGGSSATLGDPAPVPSEGGKGPSPPPPKAPSSIISAPSPREARERGLSAGPPRGRGLRLIHPFNNIHGVSPGHSPAILATGRTKELPPELKENFIRFVKSLGLTDDNIVFPVPIGNGQLGRGEWGLGLTRPNDVPPGKRGEEARSPLVPAAPGSHFGFRKTMPQPRVCGAPGGLGPKDSPLRGDLG